jgi:hypothetical protein
MGNCCANQKVNKDELELNEDKRPEAPIQS